MEPSSRRERLIRTQCDVPQGDKHMLAQRCLRTTPKQGSPCRCSSRTRNASDPIHGFPCALGHFSRPRLGPRTGQVEGKGDLDGDYYFQCVDAFYEPTLVLTHHVQEMEFRLGAAKRQRPAKERRHRQGNLDEHTIFIVLRRRNTSYQAQHRHDMACRLSDLAPDSEPDDLAAAEHRCATPEALPILGVPDANERLSHALSGEDDEDGFQEASPDAAAAGSAEPVQAQEAGEECSRHPRASGHKVQVKKTPSRTTLLQRTRRRTQPARGTTARTGIYTRYLKKQAAGMATYCQRQGRSTGTTWPAASPTLPPTPNRTTLLRRTRRRVRLPFRCQARLY